MSDCSQLEELYEPLILGALDPNESVVLREHLARGCPDCTAGVARARALVANLAYLAPEVEPPPALRRKIIEAATRDIATAAKSRTRPRVPEWAWAAAAVILLGFAIYTTIEMRKSEAEIATILRQESVEQQRTSALETERQRYQNALAIMAASSTKQMELKPTKPDMPAVTAYWNPKMGLVLAAAKMPDMPASRTLQLWVVPRQGALISAGMFHPDANGQVLMVMPPNETAMNLAKALAISDEPAGGSSQPTSAPEWMGAMGG